MKKTKFNLSNNLQMYGEIKITDSLKRVRKEKRERERERERERGKERGRGKERIVSKKKPFDSKDTDVFRRIRDQLPDYNQKIFDCVTSFSSSTNTSFSDQPHGDMRLIEDRIVFLWSYSWPGLLDATASIAQQLRLYSSGLTHSTSLRRPSQALTHLVEVPLFCAR